MAEHVYRLIEVVGSSKISSDDAVRNAIARARKTVKNMRWFQVVETRGQIDQEELAYWQVTLKIGFTMED